MGEPTLDPRKRMNAIVAARFVADHLGYPALDDRILHAFEQVILPAHEAAVREQVARQIEAADVLLPHVPVRAIDLAAATKERFAAIARGGKTTTTETGDQP